MKKLLFSSLLFCGIIISAQQQLRGLVLDVATRQPLEGIRIGIPKTQVETSTNSQGRFVLDVPAETKILVLSGDEYKTREFSVSAPSQSTITFYLVAKTTEIQEVKVYNGYQKIPKERATGSFSTVDNQLLQKQVTTNIMERLPAVANGLLFTKGIKEEGQLMVRGLSTMNGPKNPLIIVDNFPYEGDLGRINPNIIENVTILKDAAAASIWGARAANGVIVITTKEGKFNQPFSLEFTANTTLSDKPNLFYARQISSSDFIDVETQLFKNGYYNSDINSPAHPVLTPVVDILNKEKNGQISSETASAEIKRLRMVDVRDQYKKYMYSPMVNQQYAVNMSAGTAQMTWSGFVGFDNNIGVLNDTYQRLNTRFQNTWKPLRALTIATGIAFTNTLSKSGRSAYNSITMKNEWKIPYMEFADREGNALVVNSIYNQEYKNTVQGNGLLDWNYYPLTDWQYSTTENNTNEILIDAGINYKILKGLEADVKYQYQRVNGQSTLLNDEQSYSARLQINQFAKKNTDGSINYNIPIGGILTKGNTQSAINNFRGQINYSTIINGNHEVAAMIGGEIRTADSDYQTNRFYGYNANTKAVGQVDYIHRYPNFVTGEDAFITSASSLRKTAINFISMYANAAYTYKKRYTLSGSARRDASNLFGLKTNDQWNPFWSAGVAWHLSNEDFYATSWLPNLKFRSSYGFNGNIDPAMVAVTTIAYDADVLLYTGGPTARISNYFNPNLRWEMMKMLNFGVDFSTKNHRISGSLDYFKKKGSNLFGQAPVDYTSGITYMLWNVAGMKGHGLDLELKTKNTDRVIIWNTTLNFSTYHDQVTDYYLRTTFASDFVSKDGSTPPISGVVGLPVYGVFAYKWAGLDPQTGEGRGYLNGQISKEYSKIMASNTGIEDLEYFGSAVPTSYGSFLNSFLWKQFTLDIGLTYKFGYWFRRSSINYSNLIVSRNGHSDYAKRWQKPGDEAFTDVPVAQFTANAARDAFYNGSSALVEKGDHIRLQYIQLGYQLSGKLLNQFQLKNISVYTSINNIGVIWMANKSRIDPDYNWGAYSLKPVTTYSFGLKAQF